MELISRFVLHIENYFLLSHFSKGIILWTLTALAIYGMISFFVKKWDNTKVSIYVGFAVRLALLIGLSIEMLHQANITEIANIYYDRQPSLRQFLQFLFFGYIIVVGFYYILTLKQKKNQGIFYILDIAVLTLPALQFLTSMVIYMVKGEVERSEITVFLIILLILIGCLILFFLNYWEIRWLTIIPFYVVVLFVCLLIFALRKDTGVDIMEISNLIIFLGLLMTYHLFKRREVGQLERFKRPFSLAIACIFLVLCNPLYNVADAALAKTDAEVRLRYYESTNLVQLEEAKELATIITGDRRFMLQQSETEDFHNRYFFQSENYAVDIHGISGEVFNLHRRTKPVGNELSNDEYIVRSKQLLQKMGRTLLPDNQINISVTEEESRVKIEMQPKLSEGFMNTTISWEKESLVEFHENLNIYSIETLKDVRIDTKIIESVLNQWYKLLGQKRPEYVIDDVQYGYSNRTIEIYIITNNNHLITIDGRTGEILYFSGSLESQGQGNFEEIEAKILAQKKVKTKEWQRERHSNFWEWREKDPDEMKLTYVHQFGYTEGQPLFMYDKGFDYYREKDNNIKNASSREAYEAVAQELEYTPYASRAKLTEVVDENDKIHLAWLIVIQPYKTSEHRLYLVDVETKEWVSLYE
ncbi:hypothetical protein [Robertmurraya kyonggiensis]|uniref:Uncharacterized protein n=1 Tax=Robertmurraya kyonggiensis TaxID=1037680 RepID=A0A4U1DDI7_9BACI|nr:hypothetical protein [Robertmurraya kyonggiensis]TKC19496.1 hypothetical protein FA727_08130 [Robertmurraya kyonggiensis]